MMKKRKMTVPQLLRIKSINYNTLLLMEYGKKWIRENIRPCKNRGKK